jgi:hypothetical protein
MRLLRAMYRTTPTRRRRNRSPEMVMAPDRPSIRSALAQPGIPTNITSEAIPRRFIAPPPLKDSIGS